MPSEEIEEVMGFIPSRVTRWGTGVVGILVLLFLGLSVIAKFPDTITTSVTISDVDPPVKIIAPNNGKIQALLVHDGEEVKKDQLLAVVENPARTQDVMALQQIVMRLDTSMDIGRELKRISVPEVIRAGELQDGYIGLVQAIDAYEFFLVKDFHGKKISQIEAEMEDQEKLLQQLTLRDTLLKQQLESESKKMKANQILLQDKIIAPLEFEDVKKRMVDQQITSLGNRADMIQNNLQQRQYAGEISGLQQEQVTQENELTGRIRDAARKLRAQIDVWQQEYLIKSPDFGILNLFSVWKEFQYIRQGEPIMLVTPPLHNYVVKALLPAAGAGKVRRHQQILIELNAFPYQEFGLLKGEVKDISESMLDSAYAVQIQLTHGLITNTGRKIVEQPVLLGKGEIITNDKSVFQRLFESITGGVRQ